MLSLVGLMIVLVAVIGSTALTAILFWLVSRIRRLENGREENAAGELTVRFDELTTEIAAVRGQLERLEERADFSERLLENREQEGSS